MKAFIPELWASEVSKVFQRKMDSSLMGAPLNSNDVWAPTGETYAEAVAWARLTNTRVSRPGKDSIHHNRFVLTGHDVPRMFPICSPGELIGEIRKYATPGDYPPASPETD
jgi:hypothetical protein